MSIIQAAGSGGGSTGAIYSYSIDQSLKFDAATTGYLTMTTSGSPSSTTSAVFSCWVKRSELGVFQVLWASATTEPNVCGVVYFNDDDKLYVYLDKTAAGSDELSTVTTAVFRDVSSWYHIVVVYNTADSTAANKSKIYVNGVQQAVTATATGSAVTTQRLLADGAVQTIAKYHNTSGYAGYYLAEYHVVDGVAGIDHDDFGEIKSGVWVPKSYSGGHGNNGFYLPFSFTEGNSVELDGVGDNIRWTNATQYDIASDDDFCLEFFIKANLEAKTTYAIGEYAVSGPHFMLQLGSGTTGSIYAYYGNGAANNFDTTSYMTTTDWHHFAYVRESGTYRFYIDGVQRHSATNGGTAAFDLSQFNIGDAYPAASAPFEGTLSNLRFTIGAARYGSGTTFTVPTSTLTNDSSNVKLLAFTTSTITADASTAAVSGSITGDPRFSSDNPFSVTLGNDNSGNNHDFTSTNLVFTDVVPDSPTNNFSTLNPTFLYWAVANPAVITEGALKNYIGGTTWTTALGTMAVSSGKWYAEFLTLTNTYSAAGILDIGANNAVDTSYFLGYETNSVSYYAANGYKYISVSGGGSTTAYGDTYGAGDIIGVALDLDAGTVKFYKNNTVQNSGTAAATGLSGTFVFGCSVYGGNSIVANFGQDSSFSLHASSTSAYASDANGVGDFFYAPPSGHLAICSSNLPEPNTIDGTGLFETLTYTGTGSSQGITGLSFSPDWVWIKNRDRDASGTTGGSHSLHDTIRGNDGAEARILFSNDDALEVHYDNFGLTTFDSGGFTVIGDGSLTNKNTETFIAWNWLLGGTPTADNSAGVGATPTAGSVKINGSNKGSALAGTIAATRLSANTTSGISIVTYTGNNSDGATVAHGLTQKPDAIFIKKRADNSSSGNTGFWIGQHVGLATDPEGDADTFTLSTYTNGAIYLNATSAQSTYAFDNQVNGNTDTFVAYCFHNTDFCKVGNYGVSVSDTNGTYVYTGHRPQWLMIKRADTAGTNWWIWDNKRTPFNLADDALLANDSAAEYTNNSSLAIDILSNGFKMRNNYADLNVTGSPSNYIYISLAESPFKYANAR